MLWVRLIHSPLLMDFLQRFPQYSHDVCHQLSHADFGFHVLKKLGIGSHPSADSAHSSFPGGASDPASGGLAPLPRSACIAPGSGDGRDVGSPCAKMFATPSSHPSFAMPGQVRTPCHKGLLWSCCSPPFPPYAYTTKSEKKPPLCQIRSHAPFYSPVNTCLHTL